MKDKNKILFVVLGVLLVVVVGTSFAYFLVTANITGEGGKTSLGTSNGIKVQYDAGTGKLESNGFVPKTILSKDFKVIVTPTNNIESVTYRIYMNITENTFTKCNDSNYNEITNNCEKDAEEVVYRLKDSSGNIIESGDLTNGVTGEIELAIETKTPTTRTEYGYTLEIEYIDTNKEQNHNKNAIINGEVKVEFAEPDTTKPIISSVTTTETKTEITVNVTASDDKGVTEYWYQLNSNAAVKGTGATHTFTGLTAGTSYTVKVYVKDAAGNTSDIVTKTVTTKPEGQTSDTILAGITPKTTEPTTFASGATTDEGVFKTADPVYGGYTYYWRGKVTNNYVTFAGKCWRIVRINGDGSMRIIYDGTTCHANGTNADSIAKTSTAYNSQYNNSAYVGWTYTASVQRPTPTTGGTASNAKAQLESWYNSTITGTNATKVADGIYCNDRTVGQGTWSATGSQFFYGAYTRVYTNKKPSLACDASDRYTLKVGLITADEAMYAGGGGYNNSNYYLYNGQNYWTMSPYYWYSGLAYVFRVGSNGYLYNTNVNSTYGLRPVINLKADTVFAVGGNGTQSNPYAVS